VAHDALGNTVATIDPASDTTVPGYDPLGRAIVSADARGGLTRTGYDAVGNQVSVTDPVGNQTLFQYDGLNRVIKQIDPLNNSSTMAFDAAGRLTSTTDRDGRVQNFSYDAANRETGSTWVIGGSTVNTLTFTYDARGDQLTAADGAGTLTMAYDALDRLQSATDVYGLTLTFTYDAADRRTQVQDSLSGTTTSMYDAANRLTTREVGGSGVTPLRIDLGYSNRNEQTSLTRYSDLAGTQLVGTTAYSYDDASRVTAIVNKNASAVTLSYYNYGYDAANRVTSQTWQSGSTPGSATYTYDTTSQLLTDSTGTYSYDLNGNRTMSGYQTGTDNRLSNDGLWTYTYDTAGNQIQKSKGSGLETWYFGYDTLNHLTTVRQTSDGSTNQLLVTYTYDVLGDRVQQAKWMASTGTVTTRFHYDGQDVWADTDTSNNVQVRYLRGDVVDQIFARSVASGQPNAGVAWYLTDRQGSVRDFMDSTQTLRDHLDYAGYGNPTESNLSFGDRYKYTGREYDRDTGFQYNRARYYDTKTGRWISQDPLSFAAGDPDLYRYVGNSPTNATDPSGLVAPALAHKGQDWKPLITYLDAAGQGVADGLAMFGNAATFHQIPALNGHVNQVIADNGGSYQVANVSMHVGAYLLLAAGAVWAWSAVGLPTFNLGVSFSGPYGFHIIYGTSVVVEGEVVTTWVGALGTELGSMWIVGASSEWIAASTTLTGIPILFPASVVPAAVIAGSRPDAYSCVTAAINAFIQGWVNPFGR
jgi:RHS repeat-associated protein